MSQEYLSDYIYDEELGRELNVFVTIKGFNQLAIVEKIMARKGQKSMGLTAVTNVRERCYSSGKIVFTDLDRPRFDEVMLRQSPHVITCLEPYHLAIEETRLAYTAGPQLVVQDLEKGHATTISNDWMAYLHSVSFSVDGKRILTASTGFDTIQEIDLTSSRVIWDWNAWDHGFTYSRLAQCHVTRKRDQAEALKQAHPHSQVILIDDPTAWPKEGLPTTQTPANINGAFYGHRGQILATCYHRPELFIIYKSGDFHLVDLGLQHPHSFMPITMPHHEGYMVVNSGVGELCFLNDTFEVVKKVNFSSLPANKAKKRGFGEWLQTVSLLDSQQGLFAGVDALREGIHLVDMPNRKRRFIPNPPQWSIQTLIRAPETRLASSNQ